jgi:4-carboxymuconolactone decarboxylase
MNAPARAMDFPPSRLPPLTRDAMSSAQQAAADELIAGPRKGVKGPFISLIRSPELMARVQKVGEFLRFGSSLPPRLSEFATLVVSRHFTQQFEWRVHVPLALAAGTAQATIDALADGARPPQMNGDETLVHDFTLELLHRGGVSDSAYAACLQRFGEAGVVELVGLVGYFTMMSMLLNVARTPPEGEPGALPLLQPLPR